MLTPSQSSAAAYDGRDLVLDIMDKMDGFQRWDTDDICDFICKGLEETNVTLKEMSRFSKMTTYRFFRMLELNEHV